MTNTKPNTIEQYSVVEKRNPLAVHAHCVSQESAQRWIDVNAPRYCALGFFMDKTLTPNDFMVKPR